MTQPLRPQDLIVSRKPPVAPSPWVQIGVPVQAILDKLKVRG